MKNIKIDLKPLNKKNIKKKRMIIIYTFKNVFNYDLIKLFINTSHFNKEKMIILKNFIYDVEYENRLLDFNKKYENDDINTIFLIIENMDIYKLIPLFNMYEPEIYIYLIDPFIVYFMNDYRVYNYWKKLILFLDSGSMKNNIKLLNINKFYHFYTKNKDIDIFHSDILFDKKIKRCKTYYKIYDKIFINKMLYFNERIKSLYLKENSNILVFNEYDYLFKEYFYNNIQQIKKKFIFVISLHKTGIQSINYFLQKNGYFVYHQYFSDDISNSDFKNTFYKYNNKYIISNNNSLDKKKLIKDFILNNDILNNEHKICFSDTPWCLMYKEIYKILPESKFIYVFRDKYEWYESVLKFFGNKSSKMREVIYGTGNGSPVNNKNVYIKKFVEHRKDVIDFFKDKKDKLLVFNLQDNNLLNTKLVYEFMNIENNDDIYIEHYNQHNDNLFL